MREVAERRQQLELEHEQALAILKFKQDEIKRLQRVRKPLPLRLCPLCHHSVSWCDLGLNIYCATFSVLDVF